MDRDLFTRIVEQLPDSVKKVYLMKQGEPLLNRNIHFFVDYLREKRPDVHISFHTNGIIATRKRLKNILPKMTSLGISISAITAETYRKVHGVNKFDVVIRNLKGLSDLLLDIPENSRPHVFIDYVKQLGNALEEEGRVVEFFQGNFPGISSVDFHWVYNFQGEIEEGNMEIYEKLPYEKFPCCVFPWSSITFLHDGRVSYCFVEPRENRFLGDITIQTFEQIWNGKEYRLFRNGMAEKRFGGMANDGFYCHKCSWLWSMQSQSPRNLSCGYFLEPRGISHDTSFGKLLDLPIEETFEIGANLYLRGEIHQAMGCFAMILSTTGCNERVLEASEEMKRKCDQVLNKYKHVPLWREMTEKEGLSAEQKQCRYYPIRSEDDQ